MVTLNMEGSYELTQPKIDQVVTKETIGNYALGDLNNDDVFVVHYVGRSDDNVKTRLKEHIGEKPDKFKHFKFSYANSKKEAFEKECVNFHDCGGSTNLENKVHPACPEGTNLKCPVCGK